VKIDCCYDPRKERHFAILATTFALHSIARLSTRATGDSIADMLGFSASYLASATSFSYGTRRIAGRVCSATAVTHRSFQTSTRGKTQAASRAHSRAKTRTVASIVSNATSIPNVLSRFTSIVTNATTSSNDSSLTTSDITDATVLPNYTIEINAGQITVAATLSNVYGW